MAGLRGGHPGQRVRVTCLRGYPTGMILSKRKKARTIYYVIRLEMGSPGGFERGDEVTLKADWLIPA